MIWGTQLHKQRQSVMEYEYPMIPTRRISKQELVNTNIPWQNPQSMAKPIIYDEIHPNAKTPQHHPAENQNLIG